LRWDVFDSLLWLNRWPSLFQLSFHNYLISTYPAINHDSTYRTPNNLLSWRIWEPSQSYSVGGYENPLNRSCQLITRKLDSRPSLVNCVESTTLFYCRRRTKSGCIVATTKHQIFRPYQVLYEYPLAVRCCSISS
jgi:hypothetical protein